jgi:hypothetical protein
MAMFNQQSIDKLFDWIKTNGNNLAGSAFITEHVDVFLSANWPDGVIGTTIKLFSSAVHFVEKESLAANPLITFPLKTKGKQLSMSSPHSVESLSSDLDMNEPPSLYLLSRELKLYKYDMEEYISPVTFLLPGLDYLQTKVYYREYRTTLAIKNNWEFSRVLYVEYYPHKYSQV